MVSMASMEKVRHHLDESAKAHRKAHEDAIREAAVARAEADAASLVSVPQTGLQGPDDGYWETGEEG